jgi:hypothetical protein
MKTAGYVTALIAIAVCSQCSRQEQEPSRTPAQVENASLGCPVSQSVPVDAMVVDVPDGVGISFTGPPRAVDRIRANVHAMQDANDTQGDPFAVCPCAGAATVQYGLAPPSYGTTVDHQSGQSESTQNGNPTDQGRTLMQPMRTVPVSSSIDDIPEGALLVLKPKDAGQLPLLRDVVRRNVGAMETACVNPS